MEVDDWLWPTLTGITQRIRGHLFFIATEVKQFFIF